MRASVAAWPFVFALSWGALGAASAGDGGAPPVSSAPRGSAPNASTAKPTAAAPLAASAIAAEKRAPAKPVAKAKAAAKPAKPAARAPNEAVRRVIAGAPTEAETARGAESPELIAMREADRELFPPASPAVTGTWPSEWSFPAPVDPNRPVVHASGFAPHVPYVEPPIVDGAHDTGWLRALALPDIPLRWDARVVRYLEYYKDDPRGRSLAGVCMKKSGRYVAAMRRALRAQAVPDDLAWVSLVESGFDPTARSPAGAAGLWQFMTPGARIYGLTVDRWIDERLDPERATEAAARYLSDLHRRFGAWELALAAYNMGYGGLLSAIKKYNTNDYWELSRFESGIPWETTLYVPRIIAMAIVAKNYPAFGLDALKIDPPIAADDVMVPGGVTLRAIAAASGVDVSEIESYNPQIRAGRTPPLEPGSSEVLAWRIRVPVGKGALVKEKLGAAQAAEPKLDRWTTRLGDSIDTIAAARRTTRARLQELNALRPDEAIRPGTVLLVPPSPEGVAAEPPKGPEKTVVVVPNELSRLPGRQRLFYRIVTGDTLDEIAQAFRVRADDLSRWNTLDPGARMHEGMILEVFAPDTLDRSRIVCLTEADVRVLVVGSEEFFAYFEGLRGRKRLTVLVQDGDSWDRIGKRYNLTPGQLERINRRSRGDRLTVGEPMVVYAPLERKAAPGATPPAPETSPTEPLVAPRPEELPPLPEVSAAKPPPPSSP
jgi:membrane-bound lytic murein transglycosylase D